MNLDLTDIDITIAENNYERLLALLPAREGGSIAEKLENTLVAVEELQGAIKITDIALSEYSVRVHEFLQDLAPLVKDGGFVEFIIEYEDPVKFVFDSSIEGGMDVVGGYY
jgi:hypothetical protein